MRTEVNTKSAAFPVTGIDLPQQAIAAGAPRYEIVKRYVSEAIVMGAWPPGTVLPGEITLAQTFGVAVGTVRRALSDLTREGMLARRRKTGTVVTGRTPHHSLRSFFQFFRLHSSDGSLVRSVPKVLSVTAELANNEEAERLRLPQGSEVLRIHRLRYIDGRPVMRDRLALPRHLVPDFSLHAEAMPDLLYAHLLERYGIRVAVVREQLTAVLADEEDAELLQLPSPSAVLRIVETTFSQANVPVIFAIRSANTAKHMYVNEIM
jgi:GntR family transcriptional regulator